MQDFIPQWPLKVLILSSDPRNADRLRLAQEHRDLQIAIRGTRFASSLDVLNEPSCRYSDITAALDRVDPHILHFSGHGGEDVLYFEDVQGIAKAVQKQALASVLSHQKELQLVILNACFSLEQGQAFADAVGLAIVSEGSILDHDAIDFSREFYTALGYGQRSYIESFERAKSALEMTGKMKVHLLQRKIPAESLPQAPVETDQCKEAYAASTFGMDKAKSLNADTEGDAQRKYNNFVTGAPKFGRDQAYTVDDIDRDCLRTLRCPNMLAVKNRLREKDTLLKEPIEWIFHNPQYVSWQDGDHHCLLWIKGGAGKGKTMMSIGLIEEIQRRQDGTILITYFFCQNTDYELNTIGSIIKGLILQLVDQQKQLKACLRSRWDKGHRHFNEDITSWRVLWDIFLEMLDRCDSQRVYVVVDALDECEDEGMASFFKVIVRTGLYKPSKLKWLLTSRPLDSAEQELLEGKEQVLVSLELNSNHVAEAVRTYIARKVAELSRRHRYKPELRQEVETELRNRAEETYLWVSLACKRLEDVHRDQVLKELQELPPGLPAFYRRIFDQLSRGDLEIVQKCLRLLKVMVLAYRPLDVTEVYSVTGISDEELAVDKLVDRCASFIKMRRSRIEFVHKSARDYLAGEGEHSLLEFPDTYGHSDVALSCVTFLQNGLKVNLVDLPRPDSNRDLVKGLNDEGKSGVLTSIGYAATFWAQHLKLTKSTGRIQTAFAEQGVVSQLLYTKVLEWLECLSLLDQLSGALEAFEVLLIIAKSSNQPSISLFIQDVMRFLMRHYQTIVTWPLQIYSSAIIFSPQISVVRKNNVDKIPQWLRRTPLEELEWASLIQTLAGHSEPVTAVAFSPDGKRIASGSKDYTIKLWDIAVGELKKTLIGHSAPVWGVAFSPNNELIVSGASDNTIKLWDTVTGDLQATLIGHTDRVVSVTFSPDGKRIASSDHIGEIKLWNIVTRKLEKSLERHSWYVSTVVFSSNNKWIASGSWDGTIKLWDATTGDFKNTLAYYPHKVASIAFSPDNERVVSGSDMTTKLWNIATGEVEMTVVHSSPVKAVAASSDGKRIAIGLIGRIIELRSIATGELEKTLNHTAIIYAVAFSPDGERIASGATDNIIKLWDIGISNNAKTLISHSDWVTVTTFSPDGKWLATGSRDNTIKLWNAITTDYKRTLTSHSGWISAIVFLPNSKWIVSGSYDYTIKLWNVATGELKKTINHTDLIRTIALSPNGKKIASGSHDKTIMLWDIATGDKETLNGHSDSIRAIAFSPDNKRIASGSSDHTIKLWNIATSKAEATLIDHSDWITAVAFSLDGKWIASGSDDKTIRLWNVAKSLKTSGLLGVFMANRFEFHSPRVIKVSNVVDFLRLSADGQYLLTNVGPILIKGIIFPNQADSSNLSQHLYVNNQWLCYETMPILRLQPGSEPLCQNTRNDLVSVGFNDGRVLTFDIDRVRLRSILDLI